MHLDALKARRTQAGEPVVHGIHLLLWALDSFAASQSVLANFQGLRVQFSKFVYLDEAVEVQLVQQRPDRVRIVIAVGGTPRSKISIDFGDASLENCPDWANLPSETIASSPEPLVPEFGDIGGKTGRLAFRMLKDDAEALFPAAAKWLGVRRLAALASSTHLVGMICPGLNSIYDELNVRACAEPESPASLSFRVTQADARVRSVEQEIAGGGLAGMALSFARTPPVEQASMASLAGSVDSAEFAGSLSLIVGGSRGLGELSAKLIASGGGRVIITWRTGKEDAGNVAADIRAAGGYCETLPYDAGKPAREQLAALAEAPTHVYYFPTPSIFRAQSEMFSAQRLQDFVAVYVDGFWQLIQTLRERQPALSAFYPSSVAVTERPRGMTEYSMAKAAGEVLCADINVSLAPTRVTVIRLPRLPTDQTSTVADADGADPLATMLPIIREVQWKPQ